MSIKLSNADLKLLDFECRICNQIIIKPHTLNECLHTYCESCIQDHTKEYTKCPTCDLEYGPTIHNHVKFDAILDCILQKIKDQKLNVLKRKRSSSNVKRPTIIQILNNTTSSVTMSRANSLSEKEGVYLFGLEPAVLDSKEYLECPNLENPILKSKASMTIRNLQKHLRKHLWPDQEIPLEDIHIYYNDKFLGPEWSVEYIARTLWKNSAEPMIFNYTLKRQVYDL